MEIQVDAIQLTVENEHTAKSIKTYVKLLLDYNRNVNLISRRITTEELNRLLDETIQLNNHISHDTIIDAGSGNGILGIPIALINENKQIVLVEPQKKKLLFLRGLKDRMGLHNIEIRGVSIEEYLVTTGKKSRSLIARGFPGLDPFRRYLKKELIDEALIITSQNKIKKNGKHMESLSKKIYNIPLRNDLKILKIWRN